MNNHRLDPVHGWVSKFPQTQTVAPVASNPMASSNGHVGQVYQIDSITSAKDLAEVLNGGSVSHAGSTVNEQSAMRVATVFRCVRLIADVLGTLPLKLMKKDGDSRLQADEHELYDLLHSSPNDYQTAFEFKRLLTEHILLEGNAYALKVKSRNKIIALLPINPYQVTPKMLQTGEVVYIYTNEQGSQKLYSSDEIFHLRGYSRDGIKGRSIISQAREAIGVALTTENHGANVFKNGTHVGSVLETTEKLSKEAYERLKDDMQSRSGSDQAGKNMILEEGLSYKPIGMSLDDAQFIGTREFTSGDICKFFGVPPHLVGDTNKATSWGKGIEEQNIGFVNYTLLPHIVNWQERAKKSLLNSNEKKFYFRFSLQSLLRGDMKTRFEVLKGLVQFGIISPDEARKLEDMNPRTDGKGGQYYEPPNAAGGDKKEKENDD